MIQLKIAILFLFVVLVALTTNAAFADDPQNSYLNRWMVTAVAPGTIKPPLTLEWERSPISFESGNASGYGEWPGRRIALTDHGFVTVIRKTLYLLDKENGRTLWMLPLKGFNITDWKVAENVFFYTSVDSANRELIYGTVDLTEHKERWIHKEPQPILYESQELVISDNGLVIYVSDGDNKGANDAIVAIDIKTGDVKWRSSTDSNRALASFSWFIFGKYLNAFVTPKNGGLHLKRFDLADGKPTGTNHIFGSDSLGNGSHPNVTTADGITFIGYNKILRPNMLWLLAYDMNASKLLWSKDISAEGLNPLMYFKHIIRYDNAKPMVATIHPSRFMLFDSEKGSILKDTRLPPAYAGWTDRNTSLYSYPYLLTGARRHKGNGMAFDLIALNLETGKVDWSYEIETRNSNFTNPTADILNFVVKDDRIFIGRSDARIMSFRFRGDASPASKQ